MSLRMTQINKHVYRSGKQNTPWGLSLGASFVFQTQNLRNKVVAILGEEVVREAEEEFEFTLDARRLDFCDPRQLFWEVLNHKDKLDFLKSALKRRKETCGSPV